MSNINVRVVGTANVTQMSGAFGKLESQVTALNAQLAQMVALQNGVDPSGYERMTRAAAQNSKTFRNAAASTGMFEVQQLKVNRATDDYINKLQRQKMSFRELIKERKTATAAYKEQLAMEQMVVRQNAGGTMHGKNMLDVVTPREVSAELDTAGRRMAWFNEQVKSGAHQMVNWGKNTQWAGRQLMVGFTMPIAAFGAAAGVMAYQVDKELTRIAKVYDTTASEGIAKERELMAVRKASMETAITSAREYGASGKDTLNVQAELAATGLRGAELQKANAEVMRISRLGELEHADAIAATVSMQSVFRMSTDELTESFNYMNSVENATSLQTKDFAQAIPIAAAPVKEFGGDIKELGILLTAMKERGIEATQGANAIKAAMQRLGRPSKQIQEEWKAITGTDITKIFQNSDSLIDLFQQINLATEDLGNKDRIKAFAGLFGSYQVTRMSALVSGMGDLEKGIGQVSVASQMAEASAKSHAETAKNEIETYKESLSGGWDRALAEMQLQMSTLGQPFVEVATIVVRAVSTIIEKFNELPRALKVVIAGGIGLAAIAGPLVMLTGLFANLMGNGLKVVAMFTGMFAKMNIADKETRAATMAADLHSASLNKEATAAQLLTMNLQKLTMAQTTANRAAREGRIQSLIDQGMTRGQAYGTLASERRRDLQNAGLMNQAGESTNIVASNTAKTATESGKASKNWKNVGIGVAGAAAAGSVFLMESEGVVGEAAKIVFYASLLGPILSPLGLLLVNGFKSSTGWAAKLGIQMKANLATAAATNAAMKGGAVAGAAGAGVQAAGAAAATGAAASKWGKVTTVAATGFRYVIAIVKTLAKAMGPAGWIITGLGVAYAIWKKVKGDQQEAIDKQRALTEKQLEGAKAIASASRDYADETGRALKNLKSISTTSMLPIQQTRQDELIKQYKSEDFKPYIDTFKAETTAANTGGEFSSSGQYAMATQRFWELQNENGLSAKEAAANIRAMYVAAGSSAYEADTYAQNLLKTLGNLRNAGNPKNVDVLRNFANIVRQDSQSIEKLAPELFYQFAHEFENAAAGYNSAQFMAPLTESINMEWMESFANLDQKFLDALAGVGITNAEQFQKFMQDYYAGGQYGLKIMDDLKVKNMDLTQSLMDEGKGWGDVFDPATADARNLENQLVKTAVKTLGLKGEFKTLAEVFADPIFKSKVEPVTQATIDSFKSKVNTMRNYMKQTEFIGGPDDSMESRQVNRNKLLNEMTQILHANGVKTDKIKTLEEALVMLQRMFNGELGNAGSKMDTLKSKAQSMASILSGAFNALNGKDFISAYQSGMTNVQQSIADDMRSNFDQRMNSALESRQSMWDNRSAALTAEMDRRSSAMDAEFENQSSAMDARFERQSNAMDDKWEKRKSGAEAYWDRRIEMVDNAIEREEKAEEKRQKMFDNEIARINKLNEANNRNIDFNVALSSGKFDEAAKIRNDASADYAATALENAAAAGSAGSARRIDSLEGRKETIEKARDAAMRAMEQREEAERRSLARSQEAERKSLQQRQETQRKHLEAVTKARQDALAKQTTADMDAQRKIWENRKESLEKQLTLFMAFIAGNEGQLKKHMKNVGISYNDFEKKVITPKGQKWGDYFGTKLQDGIREAGLKLASDKMWKKLGEGSANEMLKGMGFRDMNDFRNFMKTGEMGGGAAVKQTADDRRQPRTETRHEGGVVGEGGGSRKGVARGLKSLHPNEKMVRAQKGEFIVNKNSTKTNLDLLRHINQGKEIDGAGHSSKPASGGEPLGMAGIMSAAMSKMLMQGVKTAVANKYAVKSAEVARQQAAMFAGTAGAGASWGNYSLPGVKPWVLEAANWLGGKYKIGTIGGVGQRSNYSEHPLGRALDFMVSDNRGTQLANDVVNNAGILDAMYVIWRQRINSFDGRGWRGMEDRGSPTANHMDHVHVSFDATGKTGDLPRPQTGRAASAGGLASYAPGGGGLHKPIGGGYRFSSSHDIPAPAGTPVYAIANGVITESRAVTSGGSPGNGQIAPNGMPYRSYGEMIKLNVGGQSLTYGHMLKGSRIGTGPVRGGQQIGRVGSTGNSTGNHLHLDVGGAYIAQNWLASKGLHLEKGAANVKWDNTIANLHKGEAVLTEDLNRKFHRGVENFANGGNNEYNVTVNVSGETVSAEEIANKVIKTIKRAEDRKPKSRRG